MINKHGSKPKPISLMEYEQAFGIKAGALTDDESKPKRALDLALDCRKFEIDLYWKRAGYFWTLIGATLAGFVLVRKEPNPQSQYLTVVLGCLGFVFSFAWYCVNRGSKKWQENWENHVDLLEDNVIGPLYKIVTSRPAIKSSVWSFRGARTRLKVMCTGPSDFSVSKINQLVSLFVIALWAVLVVEALPPFDIKGDFEPKLLSPIILAILACVMILICGKTDDENYEDILATRRISTIEKPDM